MNSKVKTVIPQEKVQQAIKDLTNHLLSKFDFEKDDVAIIGIQTRGAVLAKRVAALIRTKTANDIPVGALDITLYRDDFATSGIQPIVGETTIDFDLDNKRLILIDDVLFTGRTVRAALDELMDFGRPKGVMLAVLVDRGHRELPIAADFAAIKIDTQRNEVVNLHLEEVDQKDEIVIMEPVLS